MAASMMDLPEDDSTMTAALTDLPKDVTEKVYKFVSASGGIDCSVVCPRRHNIFPELRLMCEALVTPVTAINKTDFILKRHSDLLKLIIIKALFDESCEQFWLEALKTVRQLELLDCEIPPGIFFSVLQRCQRLESLSLTGTTDLLWLITGDIYHSTRSRDSELGEFMLSVRHLSFRMNPRVENRGLGVILARMPCVDSLCLASCTSLKFKPDEREPNFLSVSTSLTGSSQKFVALDFSNTAIDNDTVKQIVSRYGDTLQKLHLTNCTELTSEIYETISRCEKLLSLSVYPQIEFAQLVYIVSKTPDLVHLKLDLCPKLANSNFSKAGLKSLVNFELSHFYTARNNTSSLFGLGRLATVYHLNLSYTDCDVVLIQSLASLENLRVLKICHSLNFDDEGFSLICHYFTQLVDFHVEGCTALNRGKGWTTSSLNLRNLYLYNLPEITSEFFGNGFNSPNLNHLTVWDCPYGLEALVMIRSSHTSLESLTLFIREGITDEDFIDVISSLKELHTLRLYGCLSLTDRSIDAIRTNNYCPLLSVLDISFCNISDDAERSLGIHRPRLCLSTIKGPLERLDI